MEAAMIKNHKFIIMTAMISLLLARISVQQTYNIINGNQNDYKHFVLVHGASHGAWCWYKLATLLRSAGHNVTALDQAASGVNQKPISEIRSIADYFEPLMKFMELVPANERVILVGHSLGGFGITKAMETFPEKIAAAVFVTALMPGPALDAYTILCEVAQSHGLPPNIPDEPPLPAFLPRPEILASVLYQLSPVEFYAIVLLEDWNELTFVLRIGCKATTAYFEITWGQLFCEFSIVLCCDWIVLRTRLEWLFSLKETGKHDVQGLLLLHHHLRYLL